jgi:hypothetical protein
MAQSERGWMEKPPVGTWGRVRRGAAVSSSRRVRRTISLRLYLSPLELRVRLEVGRKIVPLTDPPGVV